MHSRQPEREAILPAPTVIKTGQPLTGVLAITGSRPHKSLYDDVFCLIAIETFKG